MVSPLAVCREILHLGKEKGIDDISPLKLIKLAYICQGFHLAYVDKPFFTDPVEAWPYGPMIRRIYDEVRNYGKKPVYFQHFDETPDVIEGKPAEVVESVMNIYGSYSAIILSALTHDKGTPWYIVKKQFMKKDNIIPHFLIKEHYQKIIS